MEGTGVWCVCGVVWLWSGVVSSVVWCGAVCVYGVYVMCACECVCSVELWSVCVVWCLALSCVGGGGVCVCGMWSVVWCSVVRVWCVWLV